MIHHASGSIAGIVGSVVVKNRLSCKGLVLSSQDLKRQMFKQHPGLSREVYKRWRMWVIRDLRYVLHPALLLGIFSGYQVF
jgi:hypothetical protein